jgi:hypothetical protein
LEEARLLARVAERARARVMGQEIPVPGRLMLGEWAVRALLGTTVGLMFYKLFRVYDELQKMPEEERTLVNVVKKLVFAL